MNTRVAGGLCEFSFELDQDVIVVIDHDGGRSVTNAAEHVVRMVATLHDVNQHRIVYQDTDGRWDGLGTEDGVFSHFVILGARTREEAVEMARTQRVWA